MRQLLPLFLSMLLLAATPASAQDDFAVPPAPHIEDYFIAGDAPVRADPQADVTIVYFMDYQCPACRKYSAGVSAAFRSDRRLKVIYRDTPIFGPRSVEAARYAIAAQYQHKHDAFHDALMAQPLPLDDAALRSAAARAGIDWDRLEADRAEKLKAIDAQIAQNQNLSEAAGISGTPAFIVGDALVDGALDATRLMAAIAEAQPTPTPVTAATPAQNLTPAKKAPTSIPQPPPAISPRRPATHPTLAPAAPSASSGALPWAIGLSIAAAAAALVARRRRAAPRRPL